ncbi:MAG: flagellin FliC [bacterium]|nr:flagellin FliC [bacterium]
MSITVNTNMQALKVQHNLNNATSKMNTAMERMSSGYKINRAKDDAAGFAVAATLDKTISGSKIAKSNVSMGDDLLQTAEGSLNVVKSNLERIRDLTEQAANGTYSVKDREGIAKEIEARIEQIKNIGQTTAFNGKKLLNGDQSAGIDLQIGTEAGQTLKLSGEIFKTVDPTTGTDSLADLATTIKTEASTTAQISAFLTKVDNQINNVVGRITDVGAASNRLESIGDTLEVQNTNMTSALSTIKDADIAEESATYVQQQILQSASATLLTQANSAPQIALTLIQG